MITSVQYFRGKVHSAEHAENADKLLQAVNILLYDATVAGAYDYPIDPDTNSQISGSRGGAGDGGYRLPDSATGAARSSHKEANACDVYDPHRKFAAWCVANLDRLEKHGLWMEDPRWTPTWAHLQRVPSRSGKRVYRPSMSEPLASALRGQEV